MATQREVVYAYTGGRDPVIMDALNVFGMFLMEIMKNADKQKDTTTQLYVATLVTMTEKVRHHFEGEHEPGAEAEAQEALRNMRTPPTAH